MRYLCFLLSLVSLSAFSQSDYQDPSYVYRRTDTTIDLRYINLDHRTGINTQIFSIWDEFRKTHSIDANGDFVDIAGDGSISDDKYTQNAFMYYVKKTPTVAMRTTEGRCGKCGGRGTRPTIVNVHTELVPCEACNGKGIIKINNYYKVIMSGELPKRIKPGESTTSPNLLGGLEQVFPSGESTKRIKTDDDKSSSGSPGGFEQVFYRHFSVQKDEFYETYSIRMKHPVGGRLDSWGSRLAISVDQDGAISLLSTYKGDEWIHHNNFSLKFPDGTTYVSPKDDSPAHDVGNDGTDTYVWECCAVDYEEGAKVARRIASFPVNSKLLLRLAGRNTELKQKYLVDISCIYNLSLLLSNKNLDADFRKRIIVMLDKAAQAEKRGIYKYTNDDERMALSDVNSVLAEAQKSLVVKPGSTHANELEKDSARPADVSSRAQKFFTTAETGSSDDERYSLISNGMNALMSKYTNTKVISAEEDNVIIIISEQALRGDLKGVPLLKFWTFTAACAAGAYFNDHPESVIEEIWLSDYSNIEKKKFFVLKVTDAKSIQYKVHESLMKPIPDGVDRVWNSLKARSFE